MLPILQQTRTRGRQFVIRRTWTCKLPETDFRPQTVHPRPPHSHPLLNRPKRPSRHEPSKFQLDRRSSFIISVRLHSSLRWIQLSQSFLREFMFAPLPLGRRIGTEIND